MDSCLSYRPDCFSSVENMILSYLVTLRASLWKPLARKQSMRDESGNSRTMGAEVACLCAFLKGEVWPCR